MSTRTAFILGILIILAFASTGSTAAQPGETVRIIFMHHSVGGDLIDQGGVRAAFADRGYEFWDHGYNDDGLFDPSGDATGTNWDVPGDNTDPDGWYAIFNQPVTDPPANTFSHMLQYDVIIFKSCYPSSDIQSEEQFADYQRYFLAMRDVMDQHPDKIFIPFTTPPMSPVYIEPDAAARARRWAEYLISEEYLAGHPNIFVFDFFGLLADADNTLRAEYRPDEYGDSHPNALADRTVGPVFVDFVDQAIQSTYGDAPRPVLPSVAPDAGEPSGEPPQEAPVDIEPPEQPSDETADMPVQVGGLIDDFEGGDFDDQWWTYTEGNVTVSCAADTPGYESDHALHMTFDSQPGSYAACGYGGFAADSRTGTVGLSFVWRSDQPDGSVLVSMSFDEKVWFAELQASGEAWTPVSILWDDFEGGSEYANSSRLVGVSFDIDPGQVTRSGSIWVDDLQLVGVG